jgi:hypothetical protein
MFTCKWCYLQVISSLEDKHDECRKKISKQIGIRKANLEGLATASDKRNAGWTNRTNWIVIGTENKK